MTDLTIEQLERIIANHESGAQLTGVGVYRQLLATMQREALLRQTLEFYATGGFGKLYFDRDSQAKEAVASCEYLVKEGS